MGRRTDYRGRRSGFGVTTYTSAVHRSHWRVCAGPSRLGKLIPALLVACLLAAPIPVAGRSKDKISYGEGLIINIPVPVSEVEQVVQDVAQNGAIRGTKEYNKDEFVGGAKAADSSRVFPAWDQGGKVFYKVRTQAIDPRNFKDGGDVGTLVVRYVVQPQGDKNTVLRIDALFEEDFRHTVHQSNGSVELAEYKDIREHLDSIELMQRQNAEALAERQERLSKKQYQAMQGAGAPPQRPQPSTYSSSSSVSVPDSSPSASSVSPSAATGNTDTTSSQPAPAMSSETAPVGQPQPAQTLEQHIKDLRMQVERLVKSPGAPLKSAPFHTAGTLQLLTPGTEVLILINTPYWYGVETHDGQHGWMQRDQLELP